MTSKEVKPEAQSAPLQLRAATEEDVDQLLAIEQQCFSSDRLSRRSFRRWLKARHALLLVAQRSESEAGGDLLGYGLAWLHKGTRLARLYSLAVLPAARGLGVARQLMEALEKGAAARGRLYMRLEVAKRNQRAIDLYQACGYQVFGEYFDYYEDHDDALRMQKKIQRMRDPQQRLTPWYAQTTEFTCGPAALMMAMASLGSDLVMDRGLELDLWREATTIFMTSGHGGCHPVGLALSAQQRGCRAEVYLNTHGPLFIDGVRTAHKKDIITLVHEQFVARAVQQQVPVHYCDIGQKDLAELLQSGRAVLMLISTYRLDGKKAPHWVTLTGMDEHCFYLHDPELATEQQAIDCQYLPIARDDFDRMTAFGAGRLRAAVVLG
ncbi:GNAT family N-acetyltransferase/peptidase C39 family protein [Pseudomaricurvus sp. HS19]|uniref:GNAT family N-acetyltransferase/peptidase C39 family protein n=1 Tax=Pseudomaricurvus sp. HS19 TaxID=2692626 RepID=UPI00136D92ED|nr:GNAT family N-acetyltransferase/peptidase C39 family protein [Pseudomaricurvus sp. HS19]MYM64385.1 GNAT family N-acetyltransferase [Pseudomaricurvus sp. HS19]